MAAFIVPPPPPFVINDEKVEERFMDYKNKFLTFMKANGLDSKEDGQKIAIFKSYCGEDLCDQIEADESENDTLNDVLQRLHDHYLPASNILQEQFNFFIRRQRPSENFDKYLIELKKIAKNCNFGDLEENMLKVVLIMNMKDITEQQKIMKDADNKKLDILIPDFRKFDGLRKNVPGKKSVNSKIQPQKQSQPQPQKQNQPQPQKQNQTQPQKHSQTQLQSQKQNPPQAQPQPQKQNQSQKHNHPPKQNPPKQKQQDSVKKESTMTGNPHVNTGSKDKKGNPPAGEDGKRKKSKPQNGETSSSGGLMDFTDDLFKRIQNLTS